MTSIDLILCCVFSLLQSDKRASQKPFYLHPPESSGNKTKKKSSNHLHQPPALLSNKGLSSTQPNLDERLRQYSAYELNRSKPNKKKSSQLSHSIENQSDSSGSFFLHDPNTVGYNRLSDLFIPGSAAQTVCSDDSGVGLTSPNTVKPLARPKQKPPLPPIGNYTTYTTSCVLYCSQWLKMTQNVAFEFWHFPPIFVYFARNVE